jgi:hypothetical protein
MSNLEQIQPKGFSELNNEIKRAKEARPSNELGTVSGKLEEKIPLETLKQLISKILNFNPDLVLFLKEYGNKMIPGLITGQTITLENINTEEIANFASFMDILNFESANSNPKSSNERDFSDPAKYQQAA